MHVGQEKSYCMKLHDPRLLHIPAIVSVAITSKVAIKLDELLC